ncbi:hypothetical protein ACQBAR_05480 [Propionibacteriaceae bacterium Y1685]
MIIGLAILCAIVGSLANAYAAVFQHDAVDSTIDHFGDHHTRFVGWRRLVHLVRTPRWVIGMILVGLGAAFHIVGLTLASITIIQPVGITAILFAIVIASRSRGRWPHSGVWISAVATVVGLSVFVVLAATNAARTEDIHGYEITWTASALGVVVLACCLVGAFGPKGARCLAWAAACATCFGFASALLRTFTLLIRSHTPWLSPIMITVIIGLLIAYLAGGWMAQQAYASGPAEVVISTLTVVDPLIAVGIGLIVLGEGAAIGPGVGVAMALAAAAAAIGVITLAKHHPEAGDAYAHTLDAASPDR